MICETCKAEGKTSRVFDRGGSTTCAYYQPFYDEKGQHHHHDGNVTVTGYECSNGHRWTVESTGSCWCGWPKEPKAPEAPTLPKTPFFGRDDTVALMRLVGMAYALADADESTTLTDLVNKLESTAYSRRQVEAMLRIVLTDRTDEWTSKPVDERVAALLSMFTLPTTEEKP